MIDYVSDITYNTLLYIIIVRVQQRALTILRIVIDIILMDA